VVTHLGDGGRRNGLAVEILRDLLDGDDPVRVEQEDREDGALLRPPSLIGAPSSAASTGPRMRKSIVTG